MRLSPWRCLLALSPLLLGATSASPVSNGAEADNATSPLTPRQDDAFFKFALNYNSTAPGTAVKPGTKLRILCIGDSITVGLGGSDGNGYRARLRNDLSKDQVVFAGTVQGGAMTDGYYAAWTGKTIQWIASNIGPSLQQRPNIVLIHAGTNDMNPDPSVSLQGHEVGAATERLGALVDKVFVTCPDAVVLVAMIIDNCHSDQRLPIDQFQALVPGVVNLRRAAGKHAIAVNMSSIPTSPDCTHPGDQGYRLMGDYWFDFLTQVPKSWITAPVGPDPNRDDGLDENGGLDQNIPPVDWGTSPVQDIGSPATFFAAGGANKPGICGTGPHWDYAGRIFNRAVGQMGGWKLTSNLWQFGGQFALGVGRDPKYVRLADLDGDGKADAVWIDPVTGEIFGWKNNLPGAWTPFGMNGNIGSGTGVGAAGVQLADLNGDGRADYIVINPDTGGIKVWWNYGPDPNWVGGFKFVSGGQLAPGVPHANWKTLRFQDVNGDGRADYVYIGAHGSLAHFMNIGSPGGQDVQFFFQGGITSGASPPDVEHLVFADLDGDGRDDYLVWDDDGGLTGFLNQRTQQEGVPRYIYQGPAKTIASGINVPFREIRLADMDGDGKADYVHVEANGALSVWYNKNSADTSMLMDGIRFADIDGDGADDMVYLHPVTGAMTVYLNRGPEPVGGWFWIPMFGGQPILPGGGPAATVHLADLNGDGKADYLVVHPKTGALTVYLNRGRAPLFDSGWWFESIGQVAPGIGRGDHVRFADVDGDGNADYIFLKPTGATVVLRTTWNSRTQPIFLATPQADGSGIFQRPEDISFHDINGDGRADYVFTSAATSKVRVWYNNYPNFPPWVDGGEIAGGVFTSGNCIRWAKLQLTGRASYIAVNPTTGAFAAWLNGCDNPTPRPPPEIPCTEDGINDRRPGALYCFSKGETGQDLSCDECLGRNGYSPATSQYVQCNMIKDTGGYYIPVACPGDPAPAQYPDGSQSVPGAIMESFCQAAKGKGIGEPVIWGACLLYGLGTNAYDSNSAGLQLVCDVFFFGLCNFINNVAPGITPGGE